MKYFVLENCLVIGYGIYKFELVYDTDSYPNFKEWDTIDKVFLKYDKNAALYSDCIITRLRYEKFSNYSHIIFTVNYSM